MISRQKIMKKIERIEERIEEIEMSEKERNKKIIKRNKKVRWPETLSILENVWKIELEEDLKNSEEKVNGLCFFHNRTIKLCLSNKNILRTLFHEVQHAVDHEFGETFDSLRKLKEIKKFDEFRVEILTEIWMGIFKQLRGEELKNGT